MFLIKRSVFKLHTKIKLCPNTKRLQQRIPSRNKHLKNISSLPPFCLNIIFMSQIFHVYEMKYLDIKKTEIFVDKFHSTYAAQEAIINMVNREIEARASVNTRLRTI